MLNKPSDTTGPPSFADHFRERLKDWELEYQSRKGDIKHGYSQTTQAVHQAYRGTGRAVTDSYRTVRTELGDNVGELKADLRVQKALVSQDVQEFLQAGREWTSEVVARRQRSRESQESSNTATSAAHTTTTPSVETSNRPRFNPGPTYCVEDEKQRIIQEIRAYEQTLADPSFVAKLNTLIESHLTSVEDMVDYYQERPELKEFTLTKELPRMSYTLFTDKGQKLTETPDILEYDRSHHDRHDILWRAANQSIFGDVISCLTSATALVRPQFNAATFVDDISVTLDFGRDAPHITAECFVNVSIPDADGERLGLAGVLVGVFFCPASSKMEARVLHISPSQPLSDDAIDGAADNLTN